MVNKEPHKVFISYSHKNQEQVENIIRFLEKHGQPCWYAPRDLGPGEWKKQIDSAIRGARAYVLFSSVESLSSEWVKYEFDVASTEGDRVTIIPYKLSEPGSADRFYDRVCDYQFVDQTTSTELDAAEKLLEMVRACPDSFVHIWDLRRCAERCLRTALIFSVYAMLIGVSAWLISRLSVFRVIAVGLGLFILAFVVVIMAFSNPTASVISPDRIVIPPLIFALIGMIIYIIWSAQYFS